MKAPPRHTKFDSTVEFMKKPYHFISTVCKEHQSQAVTVRLALRKTYVITGPNAVRFFYSGENFKRKNAMPHPLRATLLGKGGVQGLDGAEHLKRKDLFMSFTKPQEILRLSRIVDAQFATGLAKWSTQDNVPLYPELVCLLAVSACSWLGIHLQTDEKEIRAEQLRSMYQDASVIGLRHFKSRQSRRETERWIGNLIHDIRRGKLNVSDTSPIHRIAFFRDEDGELLSEKIASVEALNLLRPIVAVSTFMIFAMHALSYYPEMAKDVALDLKFRDHFIQEVRRYYPFFPAVAAITKCNLDWMGVHIPENSRVLLDIYGINHHPELWDNPNEFNPNRFNGKTWENLPDFIPQGGGNWRSGHRCPGEFITIQLMSVALDYFTRRMDFKLNLENPNLAFPLMPPLPISEVVLRDVKPRSPSSIQIYPV
ncbi:cytochrome P450 [Bdellovibrio sp. HCB185ZH]|uniref:cytochrome P450 n=1 Tax=Bdellovibrio sp. HCB185ZH TaxID=3394235 RepID=UPI0039A5018E